MSTKVLRRNTFFEIGIAAAIPAIPLSPPMCTCTHQANEKITIARKTLSGNKPQ
jgi:hypothetical protein